MEKKATGQLLNLLQWTEASSAPTFMSCKISGQAVYFATIQIKIHVASFAKPYTLISILDRARHYIVLSLRNSMASFYISHHAPVREGSPFLLIHGGLGSCLHYSYGFHTTYEINQIRASPEHFLVGTNTLHSSNWILWTYRYSALLILGSG